MHDDQRRNAIAARAAVANAAAHFADVASREINAQQEKDIGEVMTTIDRRLRDLDAMAVDIQVVAPAPGQCYYTIDAKIAEQAHRLANEGVAEFCSRKPDRFVGLGVVTLQEPEAAVRELYFIVNELKLKGCIVAPLCKTEKWTRIK